MEIADPRHMELRIDLPVSDALLLKEGADAVAFSMRFRSNRSRRP